MDMVGWLWWHMERRNCTYQLHPVTFFGFTDVKDSKKMRKVTHNQLVDSYSHMSQRGFLLARAEKSIT